MVQMLPRYEEWDEALNVLLTRDLIHATLHTGTAPSPDATQSLERGDLALVAARSLLLRRFPEIFESNAAIPRERWWWHLDQGAHVRDAALAAGRRDA
jgi:hypothetical protein